MCVCWRVASFFVVCWRALFFISAFLLWNRIQINAFLFFVFLYRSKNDPSRIKTRCLDWRIMRQKKFPTQRKRQRFPKTKYPYIQSLIILRDRGAYVVYPSTTWDAGWRRGFPAALCCFSFQRMFIFVIFFPFHNVRRVAHKKTFFWRRKRMYIFTSLIFTLHIKMNQK